MSVEWYYTTNRQQMGPVSWDELRELAEVGILKPHDMVWSDGMDEWAKAINQSGLFGHEDGGSEATTQYKPAKPPPARRRRDDDDENDDGIREERRQSRKKEEDRAKMGVNIRIILTLVGVGLLIFFMMGCVGVLAYVSLRDIGPAPKGPVAGGFVRDSFVWNNLGERRHLDKTFRFTKGRRVVITVTNTLADPRTDVDLLIMRGNEQSNKNAFVRDIRTPNIDRNCRVEFVVPATDNYRVRVANLGPGAALACQVSVVEL